MKKITILLTLIISLFAASISAQVNNNNSLTTEQKMLPFAIGMSISVLGEMHDDNYLEALSMIEKQIPPFSGDLKPVIDLKKDAADYRRLDVAQTAAKAMRARSGESEKWQMLIGEQFGNIYAQIKKNKLNGDEINADDLKFNLELILILTGKAPADIPENIVKKFKKIGEMKDEENLTTEKNIQKIAREVVNILDTISN